MEIRTLQSDSKKLFQSSTSENVEDCESLTIKLSTKEAKAIAQYAELCKENIPDLIRKALIREATLADGFGSDDPQYDYRIELPNNLSSTEQRKLLEAGYNKIRALLGWRLIKL